MRLTRMLAVACLLLAVPACMSNNKGKIVGKWESTGGSALQVPGAPPMFMTLDFKADGAFTMAVGAQGMGVVKTINGKYSLGFGDSVTLSNLSEPIAGHTTHRETITIVGNQLTMKDSDGKFVTFKKA